MATIIDAFVVTLGLDPSGFRKGQKEANESFKQTKDGATAAGKEIEARGKQAALFFSGLKREAIGLFAVFATGVGLKEFITQTVTNDAALGRLAHNLGQSTEELSAWEGAVRRVGGASADADGGLQTLVSAFQQIQLTGNSPLIPYLNLLRVSLADLKNPSAALLKIADAFHNMDPRQAAEIGKGMGFSPALVNLLEKGAPAIRAMLEEQRKLGVVTAKDAEEAQKFQDQLNQLHDALTNIGRGLLTVALPAMEAFGAAMTQLTLWSRDLAEVLQGFDWSAFTSGASDATGALADLRAAFLEVLQAGQELFAAIPPEAWDFLVRAIQAVAVVAADLATGALHLLAGQLRVVTDIVRTVTDLLRGDWRAAWADAGKAATDQLGVITRTWKDTAKTLGDLWNPKSFEPGAPKPTVRLKPGVTAPTASGNSFRDFFAANGLTPQQARGVEAGIYAESRGNPNAVNPTSGAYGIGQWLGPRKAALFAKYGPNPSLPQQLQFLLSELRGGDRGGAAVLAAGSEQEALQAYVTKVMRPGSGTAGDLARGTAYLGGAGLAANGNGGTANDNRQTHATEVNVGTIVVHTKATDAAGIARDLGPAIKQRSLVTQANSGLG